MLHLERNRMRGFLPLEAMALTLGGCAGSLDKLSEMTPRASDFTNFEWNPYSKASTSVPSTFKVAAATPADFVNGDGSCAGAAESEGGAEAASGGAVALQMTECAVVRALGAPEKVEIGANERGERTARLLYNRGDRPGLYSFTAGHLTQVERVAEAAPAKPQKNPPAKPVRRQPT